MDFQERHFFYFEKKCFSLYFYWISQTVSSHETRKINNQKTNYHGKKKHLLSRKHQPYFSLGMYPRNFSRRKRQESPERYRIHSAMGHRQKRQRRSCHRNQNPGWALKRRNLFHAGPLFLYGKRTNVAQHPGTNPATASGIPLLYHKKHYLHGSTLAS